MTKESLKRIMIYLSKMDKYTTYEEIKRFFDGSEDFEVKMYIQYIDGILTKGKPNDHAKYCKQRLIEIANRIVKKC